MTDYTSQTAAVLLEQFNTWYTDKEHLMTRQEAYDRFVLEWMMSDDPDKPRTMLLLDVTYEEANNVLYDD